MRMWIQSLASLGGLRTSHCHELQLVCRLELLWLWCRPAAIDPFPPLAWEPPYAIRVGLKRQIKRKKRKEEKYSENTHQKKKKMHICYNWGDFHGPLWFQLGTYVCAYTHYISLILIYICAFWSEDSFKIDNVLGSVKYCSFTILFSLILWYYFLL